jgi:hypothetical protein
MKEILRRGSSDLLEKNNRKDQITALGIFGSLSSALLWACADVFR